MNLAPQPNRVKTQCTPRAQKQHRDVVDQEPNPADIRRGIRRSGLPYGEQTLLAAILDHDYYGKSELGCIASLKTLAAELDTTERSINRMLVRLLKDKWVIQERSGKIRPLRMGEKCLKSAPRPIRQGTDASLTNPSCSPDESVLFTRRIRQGKRVLREREKNGSRFAPIQQNCNPPVVHPPVADPAAQAATLARGFHRWYEEGGVK